MGGKTVEQLANFIQKNNPELKGFNRAGLYRMVQFYEIYATDEFVFAVEVKLQITDNMSDEAVLPVV